MAEAIWSQDIFSKGELSPLMYSRVTVDAYYNGLKTARNCITYPQGGIGKRFGTIFQAEISGITSYKDSLVEVFTYNDQCVYVIILIPDNILIYLEGVLIYTVTSTAITAPMMPLIDTTIIESNFRMTSSAFKPQDLVRSSEASNDVASVSATEITLTNVTTDAVIVPVFFEVAGGTIIQTSPQVLVNEIYFLKTSSTTTGVIYPTAVDAKAETNALTISSIGTGTTSAFIENAWTLGNVDFAKFSLLTFDFNDPGANYSGTTFTPTALAGSGVTLNASIPVTVPVSTGFTPAHVGGSYVGDGGVCRIISYASATSVGINIIQDFDATATAGIPGTSSFLAEPAWSDVRGWPSKCSSFQNRAVFANTRSLPNALFLSITNDYNNFDGLEGQPDSAILWYPSSDNVNVIRFIVPYRSLTIHTNSGIYSTPLTFEQAITPLTFSMTLQDSTAANKVQPRALDNQVIIIAGNDVYSMLWDGFNNSYTSTIASIANEHLIRDPIDEAGYVDINRAGSRYMFIINSDGGLVIFQTLVSENVAGFTPSDLTQTYGNAYFRWVAESFGGRCWFMTEREIAGEGVGDLVDGHSTNTLTLTTASTFALGVITAFKISTTDTLPASSITMVAGDYYWAVATDATNITVYLTHADAVAAEGALTFTSAGIDCTITPWPLSTKFYLEELSFDVFTDCTYIYSGTAESTFTGLSRFNAQMVKAVGDGYGFEEEGNNDEIILDAHGQPVDAAKVSIGFPISTHIETLDIAVPGALQFKGSSLTFPSHLRAANLMFNETIGGFVNDTPIQIETLEETVPGEPPTAMSGVMEITPMLGWDNHSGQISITHDDPFDIKLIGIFYRIET
jgi:hypothetical protein